MSKDTGAARLPGLPILKTSDQALARWAQAVAEHLEVRAGARGNPLERSVTVRELEGLNRKLSGIGSGTRTLQPGDLVVDLGGGLTASISVAQFAQAIRDSKLFQDLNRKLDDPNRFDQVPEEVRRILLQSIAEEASKRGADISILENKMQSATDSLAYRLEEITAAVGEASAGVREMTYAVASTDSASAAKITQLEASLGNYYQDGTVGRAVLEESLMVTADRVDGLSAEYMVKLNAGGAVAGFGLAASEDPTGATESSFIVQADKFAVTMPGLTGAIPFGVDASGIYINGQVRINATGTTLDSLATATGVYITFNTQFFKYDALGVAANSTLTLTANLTGELVGFVTWTALSGYSGSMPAAGTTNTLTVNLADMTGEAASFQATKVDGATYTDSVTVVKLRDGSSAVTAYLTNESHTVPADSAGLVTSFTGATTNIKVFQGAADTTAQWAFTRVDSGLTTTLAGSGTATVTLTATALPGDVGTSTITGTRAGYGNITKVFTLAKSKAGQPGGDGLDGDQGLQGEPGATTYTWIAYANNATGTVDFTIGENIGQTYIGIANNKLTPNESTDATQYTWSLIKGDQGVPGNPGLDGAPTYTWFAYATNATGTTGFTTGAWTNQTYIGIASNKASATEGTNPADYSWSLIKGADGANGTNGSNGSNGADGARGSLTGYGKNYGIYVASWADGASTTGAYLANRVINNMLTGATTTTSLTTTGHLRIGDTVTLTNAASASAASTKYWSGSSWVSPGVVIDGNLLVGGTISASSLNAGSGGTGVTVAGGTALTEPGGTAITNGVYVYQNSASLYGFYCKNVYGGGVGSTANTGGAAYFQSVGGFTLDSYNNAVPFNGVTTAVRAISGRSEYGVGVLGLTGSSSGIGVYAQGVSPGLAFYANGKCTLNGDVNIQGNLTVSGTYPGGAGGGVTSFNTRSGAVTLTKADVTGVLGSYVVSLTSSGITTALGATAVQKATAATDLINGNHNLKIQTSDGNLILRNGTTLLWSAQGGWVSDRSRKDEIAPTVKIGLDVISQLSVVDFKWKPGFLESNGGRIQTGFIAQEVMPIVPNAVKVVNGLHLLDKSELVPHLVKAVQELAAEVAALKAQLNPIP